ncbi:unnamed protein product [Meganyctiphanes norvegica]|uniref:C-type lectin domain-containing protein n=1 Tax=Meganyctiphanes norvegica TaxID=48144 RepID=A0AAV2RR74_MEGNR
MDWSWISLVLLLIISSHQDYAQACDNDCKAALTQEFRNILKQELEPIYEFLNEKFKPLGEVKQEVGTLRRDTRDMFVMSEEILQHTQSVANKQESMERDLHSVKADVKSYDSRFRELESFSLKTMKACNSPLNETIGHMLKPLEEMDNKRNQTDHDMLNSTLMAAQDRDVGCPEAEGFFLSAGGKQCLKAYINEKIEWTAAKSLCESQGLALAKPDSVALLQIYLNEKFGDTFYWLDARRESTESVFKWERDGEELSSSHLLWFDGFPISQSSSNCLGLSAQDSIIKKNKPYFNQGCTKVAFPLCEVIRP